MYRMYAFLLCVGLFISCFVPTAYADDPKRVLILNSYHPGYKWTDDETNGALAGLKTKDSNVKVYVEYMGAKWISDGDYLKQLLRIYKLKYHNVRFDALISTDNDAFE